MYLLSSIKLFCYFSGILNVHASLLPQLRGAAPIIYAIRNKLSYTGISIMKVKPYHFDTGEILQQKKVEIKKDDTFPDLRDRLSIVGAEELLSVVQNVPECFWNMKKQDCNIATYAPKIDHCFTKVKWNEMKAIDVYDLYRSLLTFKSITTLWHGDSVKLHQICYEPTCQSFLDLKRPGTIKYSFKRNTLLVTCADQVDIEVLTLSIRKKNQMSAKDFYNGYMSKKVPTDHYFS